MTKEILLSKFNEMKFEKFLQEFRFQVDNYLKNNQNENVEFIKTEIAKLITAEGSMVEDVDYRRMSYTEYERKIEELKITARKLIDSLPDDFSEVINSKDDQEKKVNELKTKQITESKISPEKLKAVQFAIDQIEKNHGNE